MKSIRSKVLASILLTAVIVSLVATVFSYRKSARMIAENYADALEQKTAQTMENLDRMFLSVYHTHINAACDGELKEVLLAYLAEGDETRLEKCAEILGVYRRQNASISSIYLLIPEARVLVTSEDYPVYKKDVGNMEPALQLAASTGGPGVLPDLARLAPDLVSFAETLEDASGAVRGCLLSNIKERNLYYDHIAPLDGGAVRDAVLLDWNGVPVTSLGGASAGTYGEWLAAAGLEGGDEENLYSCRKGTFSRYTLLLAAEKSVVLEALLRTRRDYAGMLALFLLLSLLPAAYLTSIIYRPLGKLTAAIREVSSGNLETRVEVASRDEIGLLAGEFNQMLGKIEELIRQLLEEEQRKKDAELEALQYQITPHFMYNTLNAIKCAAILKGEDALGGVIGDFIELLQACVNKRGVFLTVAEEIHILERYIRLQEFRYDGRFSIQYDVGPEARDCLVPRLVLQPLVENALLHGLDMKAEGGALRISAGTESGVLYLTVQDNGRGMTPEQIDRLLHSEVRKTRGLTAVGVPNVRDRLRLYYGDRAGLRYECGGKGTTAVIYLPAASEGETG